MSHSYKYLILFCIILIAGGFFRLVRTDLRPMHTDESVNAHKFGILLETGEYRYDKTEYHGPALYYFSLPLAWLKGQKTYQSLDESTLRMVPALFGVLLIAVLLLFAGEWTWNFLLVSGFLLAIAPALVFYNRYFIHESLLAFFSFAFIFSAFKYLKYRKLTWLILAGVFAGFMHATKETCVINYAVAALSLTMVVLMQRGVPGVLNKKSRRVPFLHILLFVLSGMVVSILFFSSFFTNWQGVADSVTAYAVYVDRAGVDDAHIHPWYFYLALVITPGAINGSPVTEVFVLITGIAGFVLLIFIKNREWPENLLLFIGFYSLILLLVYSAMPYKTPWNILQFYPGFLLLSGYIFIRILQFRSVRWLQTAMLVVFLPGCVHWGWTGFKYNFRYSSEPGNPYVYAHTGKDILEISDKIDRIGAVHPAGYDIPVEVVFPGHDYWPLPWYLRRFSNAGFYSEVDTGNPAAPVIIIHESAEKQLVRKLYEFPRPGERYLYVPLSGEYIELRPGIEMRTYVRQDVWELINRPVEDI